METANLAAARPVSVGASQSDRGSRVLPAKNRAKATNNPFFALNTLNPRVRNRRRRDLIAMLIDGLGGPGAVSDMALVTVRKAAELTLVAETVRAEVLNGRVVDPTALVRLEGEARRAVRALGLKTIDQPKSRFSPLRHRHQEADARAKAL
jgi:hypothetical protein